MSVLARKFHIISQIFDPRLKDVVLTILQVLGVLRDEKLVHFDDSCSLKMGNQLASEEFTKISLLDLLMACTLPIPRL